jgi:ethanolaminephosphotransferase
MTIAFLLTYAYGQQIWYSDFNPYLNLTVVNAIKIAIYTGAIGLSVPFTLYNMKKAYETKTFKQTSFYEAMRPLLSTIYLFIIQHLWIINSKANIIESEPRAFYWLTGTLFSNIAVSTTKS